ncbi:MAG: alpha/beta fold hydrolase [Bacteroidota bacterium]
MTLPTWQSKGEYFSYQGHQIFTLEEGTGRVLLLIHSFPTASWDWWQMWPTLSDKYRVIALDMLGFGFSDKPRKHAYSILEQADIIEALQRNKGVEKVHLLSHDYGDTVAQELLARHDEGSTLNGWHK